MWLICMTQTEIADYHVINILTCDEIKDEEKTPGKN